MDAIDRLYLDANIFILLGEGCGEIASLLYELISLPAAGLLPFFCTSEMTLAELLVRPYRERNDDLLRLYESWIVSGSTLGISSVDRAVLWGAAAIRATYRSVKLPDAIHLSTAIRMECSHVLTADRRIPDALEICTRQADHELGPARLEVLRPDPAVLLEIIETRRAS